MGLFLRTTKSYFTTGRYEILDSSFCVLKEFIQLRNKGVFACDVIKNIRYWPSTVPGKVMEDHFGEVEVREIFAIQETVDDVIYNLRGMNEPTYVMRIMDTGVRLLADDTCKDTVRIWKENGEDVVKKFKYKLPFDWHFVTTMWLMPTTTSGMHCHQLDIHG